MLEEEILEKLPGFRSRMKWFLGNRADLSRHMTYMELENPGSENPHRRLLAIPSEDRFRRLIAVMLDEKEFLSPFGIRSLSAAHDERPFQFDFGGQQHTVRYLPGESDSGMFGGNSNWRGPIWFPTTYLIIQSLKTLLRILWRSIQGRVSNRQRRDDEPDASRQGTRTADDLYL